MRFGHRQSLPPVVMGRLATACPTPIIPSADSRLDSWQTRIHHEAETEG